MDQIIPSHQDTLNSDKIHRDLKRLKVLVYLEHYNNLKKNLAGQQKIACFLQSSRNLWKEEFEWLSKKTLGYSYQRRV